MINPQENAPNPADADAFDATAPNMPESSDPADSRLAALEEEVKILKDQHLRALAEMENIRRRGLKERDDAGKFAVSEFARGLLDVADNFERALIAFPRDGLNDAVKNLITGIEATGRQLAATLERAGIKKITPLDQAFDPHFHRVMLEVDEPTKPAGTVVQVLQAGYVIHDRLLREALVAISKGGATTKVNTTA
jgi:molecular chaperone GrpE